jgi:hypothetical protein
MSFPSFLLIVEAEIDPSVEQEWNQWYDSVHLPEITDCPGFVRSARYVSEEEARRYLTVYELESPGAVEGVEFSALRGWGRFADHVKASVRVYRRVTPGIGRIEQ